MKTLIDHLTDTAGWTVNSPSAIVQNAIPQYIADYNSTSLMITFDSADGVKTAEKSIGPIDVTGMDSLVLSIWSQKLGTDLYRKQSDYSYTISLAAGHEMTLPIKSSFTDVTIPLNGITQVTRILITALHSITDTIIISEAVAEYQEMPEDALTAVKDGLQVYVDQLTAKILGTASLTAGDKSITISAPLIHRNACVKIEGGGNSEIHQLGDQGDGTFKFLSSFDGKTAQNNYTNADVTLHVPITINPDEQDVLLPGIVLWGFTPVPFSRSNREEKFLYAYDVNTGKALMRKEGQQFEYSVFIDIESRETELIAYIARAVKRYISAEVVWINGRKHETGYEGPPVETRPPDGVDIVSSLRFIAIMEYTEQTYDYEILPVVTTTTITVQEG